MSIFLTFNLDMSTMQSYKIRVKYLLITCILNQEVDRKLSIHTEQRPHHFGELPVLSSITYSIGADVGQLDR